MTCLVQAPPPAPLCQQPLLPASLELDSCLQLPLLLRVNVPPLAPVQGDASPR